MFTRQDGDRTFVIERACCFGVFFVLMASALFVAVMPLSLFQTNLFATIDQWGRSIWPKLRYDTGMLDMLGPPLGTKFALFELYCAGVSTAFLAIMLPVTWCAILRSSQRLTYPQSSAFWKVPIALIVVIYFAFLKRGSLPVTRALAG